MKALLLQRRARAPRSTSPRRRGSSPRSSPSPSWRLVLELIRRDKLQERFSVVWFVAGLGMLVGAAFPGLLTLVADAMGVRDTNVALFSIVLLFLLGLALNFSVTMSRQAAQITRLAQERALEKANAQARSGENGSKAKSERLKG